MASEIQGVVLNYRIGPKNQRSKECIIHFPHVTSISEAGRFIGRKVVWSNGQKKIVGKLVSLHGKKGLLIARFRKGLPGQALGTVVKLGG
ncbi:MAG: 50S ribosomal protein L35ae [Nitrososphaerota archaeon]|nr:50S ribosomal protein L35ae [Candidatus Bathyarchaeota archaeon]MDW8194424.1 50S ribosomal protein L35ae [Nitrososphaerota archaeon]